MIARVGWSLAAAVLVLTPLLLRATTAERQSLWQETVTTTGVLACALLVVVVVLPSRVRSLTRAFGIETVMGSHRTVGVALAALVVFHVIAVVMVDPRNVGLLLPFLRPVESPTTIAPQPLLAPLMRPPLRAIAGLAATVGLVIAAGVSARSARFRGRWERWRTWHLLAAGVALVGTAVHVLLINHLVPTYQALDLAFGDPLGLDKLMADTYYPIEAAYLGLLALIVVVTAANRWLIQPLRRSTRHEVAWTTRVSPSVWTLALRARGRRPTKFTAGQFAWLRLTKDPFGEQHPFTITSAEGDSIIEFAVRDTGDWTSRLVELRAGDRVWCDGPHGNFTPTVAEGAAGRPLVLVCGGVGIAPVLSILRTMAEAGQHAGRRAIRLILADRQGTRDFRYELSQLADALPLAIEELFGLRMSAEIITDRVPADWDADYYVCGSESLVDATTAALDELAVAPERVHTERFSV